MALSSDGNTALIGGPEDNREVGAAWVFTRSGSTWTQQGGKLTGSGEVGAGEFGWSVALSSDCGVALIGGPHNNGNVNSGVGAAWAFVNQACEAPEFPGLGRCVKVSRGTGKYQDSGCERGKTGRKSTNGSQEP